MTKSFLEKASLQKPTRGIGFCKEAMEARRAKNSKLLSNLNLSENSEKKNSSPQGGEWLSVLDFLYTRPNAEKSKLPQSEKAKESYFNQSSERFYFIDSQKAILKKQPPPNKAESLVTYVSNNPSHRIGINLTTFREGESFMVCDIDHSYAGENIIKWATSTSQSDVISFEKTFGKPIIIKTPSKGHLHLLYKSPSTIPPNLNKMKICSRLGFPIEYTFVNIELYSLNREIIQKPASFNDLSVLPGALFPYNYFQKPGFESLTQGVPLNPNTFQETDFIPEGRRNTFLFNFFRVDNFNGETVLAANRILCNPPLPDKEVLASCEHSLSRLNFKLSKNISLNEMRKPSCIFNPEDSGFETITGDFRLRDDENLDQLYLDENNLEEKLTTFITKKEIAKFTLFYNFNLERLLVALICSTHKDTMALVAYLESQKNFFMDPEHYHGKSMEGVIINYYLHYYNSQGKVLYISKEETWYFWSGQIWEVKGDSEVDAIFQNFLEKEIRFGSIESRFTKNAAYKSILQSKVEVEYWPCNLPIGINFNNGIVVADPNQNYKLISHNPSNYHRSKFPCDFDIKAKFNQVQLRFLFDLAGDNEMVLNVIRYVIFLAFVSNVNQVGVFLNSAPGGSKSTLVRLIQAIFRDSIVPLSLSEIKKGNTFQHDFAANKKGLVIAELSPNNSKNESFIQWLKATTGGDTQIAQKKFGTFYSYGATIPLFIMTSNFSASSMPMWLDKGVKDRIIDIEMPQIKTTARIKNLEQFVVQNLSALVNWALQLPEEFINDFTRVTEINNEVSTSQNPMEEFFKTKLVFIPNRLYRAAHGNTKAIQNYKYDYTSCLTPYNDIYEKFRSFLEERNYNSYVRDHYVVNQTIKADFLAALEQLIPEQQPIITEFRKSNERGFFHVMLRDRLYNEASRTWYGSMLTQTNFKDQPSEKASITYVGKRQYSEIQIPKFKENLTVQRQLRKNPLSYFGFLTHYENSTNGLMVQTNLDAQIAEDLKRHNYLTAQEVATSNCKDIILGGEANYGKPKALPSISGKIKSTIEVDASNDGYHLSSIGQKGQKWYENKEFEQIGQLTLSQKNYLEQNRNNSSTKELPQQSVSVYNPKNSSFGDIKYQKIALFFLNSESKIPETYARVKDLRPDVFITPPGDLVYRTFAPYDIDEKGFREILRETIRLFHEALGIFPDQNSLIFTVLVKLRELKLFPTLLFCHSTWVDFLIQDSPQYKPLLESWLPNVTQEFLDIYRDFEHFINLNEKGYVFTPNDSKCRYADDEFLGDHRNFVLKNPTYSSFYQNIDLIPLKLEDIVVKAEINEAEFEDENGNIQKIKQYTPKTLKKDVLEKASVNKSIKETEITNDFVINENMRSADNIQFTEKQKAEFEFNEIKPKSKPIEPEILSDQSKITKGHKNQNDTVQSQETTVKRSKNFKSSGRRGRPKGAKNKQKK